VDDMFIHESKVRVACNFKFKLSFRKWTNSQGHRRS